MVDNVKLEIAIQICAENIGELYKKLEENTDPALNDLYEKKLAIAFDEKDRVAMGEIQIIEKILKERRVRNDRN